MGEADAAGPADGAVLEVGEMRCVRSERRRCGLEARDGEPAGWGVAADGNDLNGRAGRANSLRSSSLSGNSLDFLLDTAVGKEGGAEVEAAAEFGTKDVLGVVAMQATDIPGGGTEFWVGAEVHGAKSVHKIHE